MAAQTGRDLAEWTVKAGWRSVSQRMTRPLATCAELVEPGQPFDSVDGQRDVVARGYLQQSARADRPFQVDVQLYFRTVRAEGYRPCEKGLFRTRLPGGAWVDPAQPALQGKTVIMRVWRTQVDEAQAEQYERFAAEVSLPMFRAHQGFEGHLFGRRGGDCVVITIWKDDTAADALEASPHYRDTVARINAAGFLTGRSEVERFQLHGDVAP